MGAIEPGHLGSSDCHTRLSPRVYVTSPFKGATQINADSTDRGTKESIAKRNRRPAIQTGHTQGFTVRVPSPVPVFILLDSKETGHVEADLKSQAPEQAVHQTQAFSNGDVGINHTSPASEFLGHDSGPQRRLPACANTPGPPKVPSSQRSLINPDRADVGCQTIHSVVDVQTECLFGQTLQRPQTSGDHNDGRLPFRLGSNVRDLNSFRFLGRSTKILSHKRSGIRSRGEGSPSLETPTQGQGSDRPFRQLHSGSLPEQTRRNQVRDPVSPNYTVVAGCSGRQHLNQGIPPSRERQRGSGRTLQRLASGPKGMVPGSSMGRSHFSTIRQTSRGSFRHSRQRQAASLRFPSVPPKSLGTGRPVAGLVRPVSLRLPAVEPHSQSPDQADKLSHITDLGGTMLAKTTLVPAPSAAPGRQPVQVPAEDQSTLSVARQSVLPGRQNPPVSCLASIRHKLRSEGLSEEAVGIAAAARRPSTLHVYNSRVHRFQRWARETGINPLEASVGQVADFLMSLFNEGKQVRTIKNYRSAIASVHSGFQDGSTLSNNDTINSLLKGMFHSRPPARRLPPSWSINAVLQSLSSPPYEPLSKASLPNLTHKTVFLVAAASARRRSCLHALSVKEGLIRFEPEGVRLLPDPSFLAKNASLTFTPEEIFLPSMTQMSSIAEDKLVCPVRALKYYLNRTKSIRSSDRLFILPGLPHTPASKTTLARWVKSLIQPFVQTSEPFRAHDIRSHATSKAWFEGVPMEEIVRAAAWKTPASFVSHYLTNTKTAEGSFARAVLTTHRRSHPGRSSHHPGPSRAPDQ